ncbi:hypothetical protein GUJ93_ZPchr0001g30261 [Zizania palustris]|uniref:Uncharacterized protein n=1 Tax=Zizania palustris TaxID=103762 RepID=A0A8J5SDD4_ZIZPA|nr:hypothetical protein GUJ93_ZPchr0001g30261 [Zizania palustris]
MVAADLVMPQIPRAIEVVAAASSAFSSLVGWPASPWINTTVNLLPLILRDVPLLTAAAVVVPNPISRHPYFHPSATYYISPEGVSLLHVFFDLTSATPGARRRIVPCIRLSTASFDALVVLEGTGVAVIVGVPNELLRPSLPPRRPPPPGSMKTSPATPPTYGLRYYILLLCQGSKLDSGGLLSRLYDKLKAEECLKK